MKWAVRHRLTGRVLFEADMKALAEAERAKGQPGIDVAG